MKKSRLFYMLLLEFVTIFLCGTFSYAWLHTNTDVGSGGFEMDIDSGLNISLDSIDVYLYDINANKGTNYLLDESGNPVGDKLTLDSAFDLNPYDLIFESRNRYTPVFAKIVLSNIDDSKDGSLKMTLTRDNTKVTDSKNDYCTSALRFTAIVNDDRTVRTADELYQFVDSQLETNISNGSGTYKGLYELTKNLKGTTGNTDYSKIFVSSLTEPYPKTDSIELTVTYTTSDIDNEGKLYIYLYISYDESLVDIIEDGASLGQLAISDQKGMIKLSNDLIELKISGE